MENPQLQVNSNDNNVEGEQSLILHPNVFPSSSTLRFRPRNIPLRSQHEITAPINDEESVRLYRSLRDIPATDNTNATSLESDSLYSDFSQEQTCRICRCNRPQELIACPCQCSGSVGFIHLNCLRRWIRFRRDYQCEICKKNYNLPPEPRDYKKLFISFFQAKYFGNILGYILNLTAVTPLVYFSINHVMQVMESINDENTMKLLFLGPAMLLATSIYFFLYFDWALNCFINIQRILIHWWSFGDQNDEDSEVTLTLSDLLFF